MSVFPYVKVMTRGGEGVRTEGEPVQNLGTPVAIPGESIRGGMWGEWEWDGRCLTAQVDPLGFFSMFYWGDDHGVAVSGSLIQLLAAGVPRDIDVPALQMFFRLGWFIGERTPFRGIHILPPGGRLRWSAEAGLTVTAAPFDVRARDWRYEDAIEQCIDLCQSAIENCAEQARAPLVLPLSGGRDSRHIAFALDRAGQRVHRCVTGNYSSRSLDNECLAARNVARRLDMPHTVVPTHTQLATDHIVTRLLTHLCADECQNVIAIRRVAAQEPCALFDGVGGDILSRNKSHNRREFLRLCREHRWMEAARHLVDSVEKITRSSYAFSQVAGGIAELQDPPLEDLAEEIGKYENAACPGTSFMFWSRTRREIALISSGVWSTARQVFCPFLDPRLVRFYESLPPEITDQGPFHDAVLARAFPEHTDLPYAEQIDSPSSGGRSLSPGNLRRILARTADGARVASLKGRAAALREPWHQVDMRWRNLPYAAWRWKYYLFLLDLVLESKDLEPLMRSILSFDSRAADEVRERLAAQDHRDPV